MLYLMIEVLTIRYCEYLTTIIRYSHTIQRFSSGVVMRHVTYFTLFVFSRVSIDGKRAPCPKDDYVYCDHAQTD